MIEETFCRYYFPNFHIHLGSEITIYVIQTNGKKISLKASPKDKPRDIRRKIKGLTGSRSLSKQRVMLDKHELSEDETLEEANVKDGSEIRMQNIGGKGK